MIFKERKILYFPQYWSKTDDIYCPIKLFTIKGN